ncbi:MAG: DNA replication and repair protein RecF [Bacteroidales bacterium]|nr:DNA replication and repair protein RecF [Bacteroidales bacterium]
MHIENIHLINFKNYTDAQYGFSPSVNCIVGLNGVGKTNMLDAVYYLSMTKSYFTNSDMQNIRYGEQFFTIIGDCVFDGVEGCQKISCIQQDGKRKILKYNQKEYDKLSEHIGLLPSVMVSPSDTDYINGLAETRRKYFDSIISQYDKVYLEKIISYNRLLNQRNTLLKQQYDNKHFDASQLQIWDERLCMQAEYIFNKRKEFVKTFMPILEKYFSVISLGKEKVSIEYVSALHNGNMADMLQQNFEKDYYSQHTSIGIHKDDYKYEMDRHSIKRVCSQGQPKSFLIALKLAQFELMKQLMHKSPLLLLDDVFDKLDEKRIAELIKMVAGNSFGQVFITDTNQERISQLFNENSIDFKLIEIQ